MAAFSTFVQSALQVASHSAGVLLRDTYEGEAGNRTTDYVISAQPTLPAETEPPCYCASAFMTKYYKNKFNLNI